MSDIFTCPRVPKMNLVIERLRDARQRLRLGIPLTDPQGIDILLDEAADLLEEAEADVQAIWALEMQVGEDFRGGAKNDPRREERDAKRLEELKAAKVGT